MSDLIFQKSNNTNIMGNNWALLDFFMLISRVGISFVCSYLCVVSGLPCSSHGEWSLKPHCQVKGKSTDLH